MPTVFLDHQSSTPVSPEVFEAMRPFLDRWPGNPSSLHQHGLRARDALAQARSQFAALIKTPSPEGIIFTSGGTEAVNLAVKGAAWAAQHRGKHIVLSAIEHPAVLNSVAFLETQGFTATRVAVDKNGLLEPDAIRRAIREDTILVCVHYANHDVGTIQPIEAISAVTRDRGVALFVDAVTAGGWLPIDVEAMGASLLSLSAHRFYGPKGVGVLYRHRGTRLTSLLSGGDQEQGRRAGTENVPAIVGGGVAAELARRHLGERCAHTGRLQRRLWEGLRAAVPHLALHGPDPGPGRLSTLLNVSAEFTEGEGQMLSLDMAGIAVASGTSCVSKAVKASPVLEAMGVDRALALASVLFSLGKDNTDSEIDFTVVTYARVVDRLRSMSPHWDEFQRGVIRALTPPGRTPEAGGLSSEPAAGTRSLPGA